MKRFITLACILAFAVALCACNGDVTTDSSSENTLDSTATTVDSCYSLYGDKYIAGDTQDDTTDTGFGAIKWAEEDVTEENWYNVIYPLYKQYAEYFEDMDTSVDNFRLYPYFENAIDESDAVKLNCGLNGFDIQLTSHPSSEEALDKIVIGNAWRRVYFADPDGIWRSVSYNPFPKYSFHFSKQWIYYFEYYFGVITKIVKITPDGMTVTGEDAEKMTDNLWSEEELQEESWQKIYATYANVVGYLRSDIDRSSPDFTIKPDTKYKLIYATIEGTDIKFKVYMSREEFLPRLETVRVGEHILDVVGKDPTAVYLSTYDVTRYSNHFFNNCAYHIEYENGYVSKIIKITADGVYDLTAE